MLFESLLLFVGLLVQHSNCVLEWQHMIHKSGHLLLLVAMALYCLAFVPLIISQVLDASLLTAMQIQLNICARSLMALGSLIYLLSIQQRISSMQGIVNLGNQTEKLCSLLTVIVWFMTAGVIGVCLPIVRPEWLSSDMTIIAMVVWRVFALLMDHLLTFVIVRAFLMFKPHLKQSQQLMIVYLCAIVMWSSICLMLVGAILKIQLLLTAALVLSPIQYTGALYLVYFTQELQQDLKCSKPRI